MSIYSIQYKLNYIEDRIKQTLSQGKYSFELKCDFCYGKEYIFAFVSSSHRPNQVTSSGIFHHINGDRNNNNLENIALLCNRCHKHIHGWSVNIHPWLEEIGRTEADFDKFHPEDYFFIAAGETKESMIEKQRLQDIQKQEEYERATLKLNLL